MLSWSPDGSKRVNVKDDLRDVLNIDGGHVDYLATSDLVDSPTAVKST